MPEDVMLQEAIEAIRQGQRVRARDLLTRLLRADQSNPTYWLWMSSVVETQKEQVFCLQNVLRLDPNNEMARQGLMLFGALAPGKEVQPQPVVRRKWEIQLLEIHEPSRWQLLWANPFVRAGVFAGLILVVFGLIAGGIYSLGMANRRKVAFIPTHTPGPSPTFTSTPTPLNYTPVAVIVTLTRTGIPPLWARLAATYTPTPLYINTPHAVNEAYMIALRAFQRGDLEKALNGFQQALRTSPEAADIAYYIGEVFRLQGNAASALEAYQQAISINPDFAPAYLGKARIEEKTDPGSAAEDLERAIEKDPNLGEAYLERALLLLNQGKSEAAQVDLKSAERLMPDSPLVYLSQAQVEMKAGEAEKALEYARRANEMDITLLPAYLTLGQAAVAAKDYQRAKAALEIYLTYEKSDPIGWLAMGEALYKTGQYSQTLAALDQAIVLDKSVAESYLYHGLAAIELGEGQKAVNDLFLARQLEPQSFDINLGFGRALLAANRLADALGQINASERLAVSDAQKGQVYYWRAITFEAIGNRPSALLEWKALLKLPKQAVPADWLEVALARTASTATPTPSPTNTRTPTRTPTPTRSPTATLPSVTPSPTRTLAPSRSPTASATPSPTATLKVTWTPSLSFALTGTQAPTP